MAGGKSDYLENAVLDAWLGSGSPATLYIALYTVSPGDADGGTEVTGGSYARPAVTNNATNWPAASGGSKSNGTVIQFAEATAAWGTVVAAGIKDAASGGNLLYWADAAVSKAVAIGEAPRIAVGGFVVTED